MGLWNFASKTGLMSESIRIAEHLWNDAELLVERIEHACRVEMSGQLVYDAITGELLPVAGAVLAELWVTDRARRRTLSRCGMSVSASPSATSDLDATSVSRPPSESLPPATGRNAAMRRAAFESVVDVSGKIDPLSAPKYGPPVAEWSDRLQLSAREQISPQVVIGLQLQFDKAVDGTLSRPLCELAETLLSLASGVYLRQQFAELAAAVDSQHHRDGVLDRLNDGANLRESLAMIAATIADEISSDRVSMLQVDGRRVRMIASSTQPSVDRRARQVRLLESLVAAVLRRQNKFQFAVGQAESDQHLDSRLSHALNEYLAESGTREIHIEAVDEATSDTDRGGIIGAIAMERFRLGDSEHDQALEFEQLRTPALAAIGRAFLRDQVSWPVIFGRLAGSKPSKRFRWIAAASAFLIIALCLVRGELKVPAEGRLAAAQHQRLYAPADGVISVLHVGNGEPVTAGAPLLEIRSTDLNQQQRQLEGALATAKTRLAAVVASRSRPASGNTDRNANGFSSSSEQVLETEIAGLAAQLELVEQQQGELTVTSPIAGHVDRWDLQQSLAGRPVVHGQFLLDVTSKTNGWVVELDVPDVESRYVVDAQTVQPCRVTFRLRSNPDRPYAGELQHVSGTTQFDRSGRSVLRCTLPISQDDQEFRPGATVIAQIHCGSRPLGFIWFRSLIGWARQVDWF
jgi:hypothetical protein